MWGARRIALTCGHATGKRSGGPARGPEGNKRSRDKKLGQLSYSASIHDMHVLVVDVVVFGLLMMMMMRMCVLIDRDVMVRCLIDCIDDG